MNPALGAGLGAVAAIVGGAAGGAGYLYVASYFESTREHAEITLSYGQQACLFSLPISMMIAASIGVAGVLIATRRAAGAAFIAAISGAGGTVLLVPMWISDLARYGRDPAEAVLYYCPVGLSIAALALAVYAAFIARAKTTVQRRPSCEC